MDEDMIDCFSNIPHTPAWYWKKIPGFFNVECYKPLAAWDKGVRTEEEIEREGVLEMETLVYEKEEEKENITENVTRKKRKTEKISQPYIS